MSAGDYEGSGDAFLGDIALGRVGVTLYGHEDRRGRQANGTITFEIDPDEKVLGRDITIHPDDGNGPFELVVTQIASGRYSIASQGDMPWWK